jgi:hypothetical protein
MISNRATLHPPFLLVTVDFSAMIADEVTATCR